jgi:hypothetical protein
MTEYNYFCWAKEYDDEDSFQQKRYRVFNVEVGKDEYDRISKIYHKLEFDKNDSYEVGFQNAFKKKWDNLSKEQKQEYLDIPHFNKEGFEFITGVKIDEEVSFKGKEVEVKLDGKVFRAIIQ